MRHALRPSTGRRFTGYLSLFWVQSYKQPGYCCSGLWDFETRFAYSITYTFYSPVMPDWLAPEIKMTTMSNLHSHVFISRFRVFTGFDCSSLCTIRMSGKAITSSSKMKFSLNSRQMTQSEDSFCQAGDKVLVKHYSSFSITVLSNGMREALTKHSDEKGFIKIIHVAERESCQRRNNAVARTILWMKCLLSLRFSLRITKIDDY